MSQSFVSGNDVPVESAAELVGSGEAWLLDVREHVEWDAGHAPGAHHIPMNEIEHRAVELPENEQILVICHLGSRSRFVTDALVRSGYSAANVAGGMEAWKLVGLPVARDGRGAGPVV